MKFLFQSVARFNWVVFFYYWVVELLRVFPGGSVVKNLPAKRETQVWSLVQKDPLEKEMPTHSSVLAWKISWTEEPWRAVNWGTKSQTRLSNKFFFFKLYNIVLVLPNIEMNPPQVYMCFPSWTLLPPPSPNHPSGSSQCTSPKHPVSCIAAFSHALNTKQLLDIL